MKIKTIETNEFLDIDDRTGLLIGEYNDENKTTIVLPSSKKNSSKFNGFIFGILSAACLAISNIFVKKAKLFSGSEQAMVRYGLQLILMIIVACHKGLNVLGQKEHRKLLVLRGCFGPVSLIAMHFALKFINPSDAIALKDSSIIIVPILARFLLKEKINITHIVSLLFTITGKI